jgi:hypothetical protein
MPCKEAFDIILKGRANGESYSTIRTKLVANGWEDMEADDIIEHFQKHGTDFLYQHTKLSTPKNSKGSFGEHGLMKFFAFIGFLTILTIIALIGYLLILALR